MKHFHLRKSLIIKVVIGCIFLVILIGAILFLKNQSTVNTKNSNNSDDVIVELQNKIAEQQTKIDEQELRLSELEGKISTVKNVETVSENKDVNKEILTSESISNQIFCQTNESSYTKKALDRYENLADEARDSCIDKDSSDCDKAVSRAKKTYEGFKVKYDDYHKRCD